MLRVPIRIRTALVRTACIPLVGMHFLSADFCANSDLFIPFLSAPAILVAASKPYALLMAESPVYFLVFSRVFTGAGAMPASVRT